MLQNDLVFWHPTETENAAYLSWGSSQGKFETLYNHTVERWNSITGKLESCNLRIGGKVAEFGAGMGLLDEMVEPGAELLLLDHTDVYIKQRPKPLSSRCEPMIFNADNLRKLQAERGNRYDWLVSIATFYHVEIITAAALILELGKVVKPGGHVMIHGFNPCQNGGDVRGRATFAHLFRKYPDYVLDLNFLGKALVPEYEEIFRDHDTVVFKKAKA
jgi:2-polyprenyl-3-methyl-5-hydroxy-6-metoxy-1,4-benzoquinol methylase